jgi:3-deoxy-D-manno-octulosonic-acid transferase
MGFLYNIGIRGYGLGVITAGLLGSNKAIKWLEGRKNWREKLQATKWDSPIWIHASSLGEYEQAKPLIELIKSDRSFKSKQIIVTFFSPSGYEYCKDFDILDGIFYLPLDTRKNAKHFLDIVKPLISVFVKYDFWFNFLAELQKRKIPILYFSSNFRSNQMYFRKGFSWQKSIMQKIDYIYCINKKSEKVLIENGLQNVGVCGDTRFDRVAQRASRVVPIPEIKKFKGADLLLILGSSWPIEEGILAEYIKHEFPDNLKIIIAPHDISEAHLDQIETEFPRGLIRYSQIKGKEIEHYKILLIDNIGMLANCYQYGDIAFVGGGFTNDLHNILEACAMENALMYGSKVSKYPEGDALYQEGGSFLLNNSQVFSKSMNQLLNNSLLLESMQKKSKLFVSKHIGASEKVFEKMKELSK